MTKSVEELLRRPYARIVTPDPSGGYTAEILEFPGCFAEGETADEAIANLEAAAKSWIEASESADHAIPEPYSHTGYSGRVVLRLPRSLHKQAVRFAARDSVSLNQFLVSAVATRLGAEEFYATFARQLEARVQATISNTFPEPSSMTVDAAEVNPAPRRVRTKTPKKNRR